MPHQVSVFAENRPGKIERITGVLMRKNIDIRAITISDSGDYGIVKLLVDRPQEAVERAEGRRDRGEPARYRGHTGEG